jgi:hypothetical protein
VAFSLAVLMFPCGRGDRDRISLPETVCVRAQRKSAKDVR